MPSGTAAARIAPAVVSANNTPNPGPAASAPSAARTSAPGPPARGTNSIGAGYSTQPAANAAPTPTRRTIRAVTAAPTSPPTAPRPSTKPSSDGRTPRPRVAYSV